METIEAKTTLINLSPTPGASPAFRLIPQNVRTVTYEELCQLVAEKLGAPVSKAKYEHDVLNQVVIDLLKQNCRVHTGLYAAYLNIGGSVSSVGAQPTKAANPVYVTMTPEGAVVDALRAVEVVNTAVTVMALINEVQQTGCAEMNKITMVDTPVVINGACIRVDTTKTDEGVWLADKQTGTVIGAAEVVSSDAARCVIKFDSLPADGQYRLVIATRNGEPDMDVTTVGRLVTVENA